MLMLFFTGLRGRKEALLVWLLEFCSNTVEGGQLGVRVMEGVWASSTGVLLGA